MRIETEEHEIRREKDEKLEEFDVSSPDIHQNYK
jgi:hypothetical protein